MNDKIHTNKAPDPVGSYPHARKVGNLLFLSGVGPRRPGTNVIPGVMMDGQGNALGHDIEAQCHSVFENVRIIHTFRYVLLKIYHTAIYVLCYIFSPLKFILPSLIKCSFNSL